MANKIYQEKQRFHDWLIIFLLSLAIVGLLFGAASYFWNPRITPFYSIICLLLAAGLGYVIYLLTNLRSKLTITDQKIKFKIKGPIKASRKINWEDVESCTLVKSNIIGKWDRPKVTMSDEKFYSLTGRNGLMIETQHGEHFFIGCEEVGELRDALNSEEDIWELVANE